MKIRVRRFAPVVLASLVMGGCARPPTQAPAVTVANAIEPVSARPSFVSEGSLEAHGEKTPKTRLALEQIAITAAATGDVAETSVDQVFRNDTDEVLEGTFRFPLPEGAILTGLAMEIDGKLVEGELVEREKARKAYEQIVDQMLDPALLEWENGQTFKLRVFPIEPKKGKRVVIRFVAPLHRSSEGLFFAYRAPSADGAARTERVSLTVDGKKVAASGEVLVKVADRASAGSAEIVSETTKDASYWFAHVRPDLGTAPPPDAKAPQALILLCDRSRSMLEARGLQKRTASMLLDKLARGDRFTVITGDVRTRQLGALRGATAEDKSAALGFLDSVEPDGASDVGKLVEAVAGAIKDARAQGLDPVVVYLGDGTATWGETRASELERITKESLGGATMHVVTLGKSADEVTTRALAAGARGHLLRPKTEDDAARAATEILSARTRRRVEEVHLVGADGMDVPSAVPSTIYEGDEVTLALEATKRDKRDKSDKVADEVRLVGMQNGKELSIPIKLGAAMPARHVAQRWAKAKIDRFERDGDAHKEEIIKTSLDHGVMSRYTSFLVLDSEEAYARFQIERKKKAAASEEASVSGRDLDGDGRTASVSPDHLQPGDPEVRIPAPADAQSVVVVFPFGETKTASFEQTDRGGFWVSRFLVDRQTPDGTYEIVVRITHKDGRVEILQLPYVVDTQRPNLDVTVTHKRGGAFEIRAKQRLTAEEIEAQAPSAAGTLDERRRQYAHILTDAKRVEIKAPDGQILSLVHVRLGEFVGTWTPNAAVVAGAKMRVVAVDRALNEKVFDVEIPR